DWGPPDSVIRIAYMCCPYPAPPVSIETRQVRASEMGHGDTWWGEYGEEWTEKEGPRPSRVPHAKNTPSSRRAPVAHHEKYGSGRSPEAVPEPGAEESAEPLWQDSAGGRDGLGDPATEIPQSPSTPSPREQWFGGFEGAPPPPPPYAHDPEDTPSYLSDVELRTPALDEEGGGPAGEERTEEDTTPEEEVRGGTVRPNTEFRERSQRFGPRTVEEGADPLAPRRL